MGLCVVFMLGAMYALGRVRNHPDSPLAARMVENLDSKFTKTVLPKTVRRGSSYDVCVVIKNTDIKAWGENVFLLLFEPSSPPVGVPFTFHSLPDWPAINDRVFRTKPSQFGKLVPFDYEAEFSFTISIPNDMERGKYRFAMQLVEVVSDGNLSFNRFGARFPVAFTVD